MLLEYFRFRSQSSQSNVSVWTNQTTLTANGGILTQTGTVIQWQWTLLQGTDWKKGYLDWTLCFFFFLFGTPRILRARKIHWYLHKPAWHLPYLCAEIEFPTTVCALKLTAVLRQRLNSLPTKQWPSPILLGVHDHMRAEAHLLMS